MAGWGSDREGTGILCNQTEWLWDGDENQAYVGVICRLPRGHVHDDHYDPALNLTWPQAAAVTS